MSIQIIPGANFNTQLIRGVKSEATKIIGQKVLTQISTIKKDIGNVLAKAFSKTDVARSLLGGGVVDLQAHLGMTSSEAGSFVNGMQDIIREEINIITSNNPTKAIAIQAINSSFNSMLSLPGAEHTNKNTGTQVPVALWLLVNPNIDIGQAAFDIVFGGEFGGKFDNNIKESRSGRAIMVALEKISSGSSYVLPDIARVQGGQNFIVVAIQNQIIANEIGTILIKRLS